MSEQTDNKFDVSQLAKLREIVILYAEDDEQIRKSTEGMLSKLCKKIYIAENGKEALELYKKHSSEIELIISDINMPIMDGMEFLKHVRRDNQMVVAMLTTAHGEEEYYQKAIDLEVDKYFKKPVKIQQLIKAAIECLHKKTQMKINNTLTQELARETFNLRQEVQDHKNTNEEIEFENKKASWFITNCLIQCTTCDKGKLRESTNAFKNTFDLENGEMITLIVSANEFGISIMKLILNACSFKKVQTSEEMLLSAKQGDFKAKVVVVPIIKKMGALIEGYKIVIIPSINYLESSNIE